LRYNKPDKNTDIPAQEKQMEHTASFGYWLRRRRKALDLTQADLVQRVGCSLDTAM